jgi:hypothetical protein
VIVRNRGSRLTCTRGLTALCAAALCLSGCSPTGAPILDKDEVLARQTWWDNRDWDWYKSNIPFFESPDSAIDATYYYRWEVVTKHLTYGSPETGYTFTEFIDRPYWSGTYGAISCPLGHQHYDLRWLKDRRIVEDFARYWFETPGAEPRSYSNWYGDAMWATYMVLGDTTFLRTVLPHMETQYEGWVAERWDPDHGMFRWDGMHDGMEFNIDSRQTAQEFDGAEGYRPTLNSYLYADQLAISRAAATLGDTAKARLFAERAAALTQRVQEELWDPEREFFFHQYAYDEQGGIEAGSLTHQTGPYAGSPHGREEIGFVPWQFGLPDAGYEAAWQFLMDPDYFLAPYGPTTAEQNDPLFLISPRCCYWSGNSWPYATSQTLAALSNLLHDYEQSYVTRDDYNRLLGIYTRTHRKEGRPYIAEAAHPETGSWAGHDTFYHSEHYFHSHYIDLIVTGLVGLRPRADDTLEVAPLAPEEWDYFALDDIAYRGHRVSVAWDRDGSRYGRGRGLMAFVDGRKVADSPEMGRLVVPLEPASTQPVVRPAERLVNLAVNNGRGPFPSVTASYSAPGAPPFYLNDGAYWYHRLPPNRWTAAGSGDDEDWIIVDFGIERPVEVLKLYFLDDSLPTDDVPAEGSIGSGETGEVRPPQTYAAQMWRDRGWVEIPGQRRSPESPTGRHANTVSFDRVLTPKIRVVLTHRAGASSGLSEIEAWAHVSLPLPEPTAATPNLAYNMTGQGYPLAKASFTYEGDRIEQINDGQVAFPRYWRNRWTAYGSPDPKDWVEIDFGETRKVRRLELYLWGDGSGVEAPRSYAVQAWDGQGWAEAAVESQVPERPEAWALNTVWIEPVETSRIRVVLEHDLPAFSGITELKIMEDTP